MVQKYVQTIVRTMVRPVVQPKVPTFVLVGALLAGAAVSAAQLVVPVPPPPRAIASAPAARLAPTAHPPVPTDLSSMWLVPEQSTKLGPALSNFVRGVALLEDDNKPAAALPLLNDKALATTAVADYARYYTAIALSRLDRNDEARTILGGLAARNIDGHLPEDAAFKLGEVLEAQKDYKAAVAVYETLVTKRLAQPQLAWLRLGLAADQAGQPMRSVEALQRVYYDYPLTAEADRAGDALDKQDVGVDEAWAPKELARADALYQVRRWSVARKSYDRVKPFLSSTDRERVVIRMAACDIALGKYREGRDALRPYLSGPLAEEANFHNVNATRGLKLKSEHRDLALAYVDRYPNSVFAEEVLNNLATEYIIDDDDAAAAEVFRNMLDRFPAGRFAERAAWKAGWWAYRQGRYAEALEYFDKGASQFPRSDYRPSWLYWSGRAAQQLGDLETGVARLKLAATDYHNSYYGRLAVTRLQGERGSAITPTLQRQMTPAPDIPTADRIQTLLAVGLNREAMNELQYAQRVWGDSPQLQATIAMTHVRLGNVRAGINAMKRAYPQYLAAGGETLPREILKVIFPVDYWPLLQKYSKDRGLDPYVVAALVAQESNFDREVRSHANAYGLMQIVPSTGRIYARRLGVRPFSTRRLTEAETNVRLGTQIFADTIRKFGGVHFALAAYNAGDSRVVAWQREKPGLPQDEFIDDIPFPETQNYVKRILGTAEDYRYLYSSQQ